MQGLKAESIYLGLMRLQFCYGTQIIQAYTDKGSQLGRNILLHKMVLIHEQQEQEMRIEIDRLRQGRLKLSKNKKAEEVEAGAIVMLRRSSKYDSAQIGVVTNLTNHKRDAAVRVQSGHCFMTSVGNLIPVGDVAGYAVGSGLDTRGGLAGKPVKMINRVGRDFTHSISLAFDIDEDLEVVRKYQETLKCIPGIGEVKKLEKMHITMMCINAETDEQEEIEKGF